MNVTLPHLDHPVCRRPTCKGAGRRRGRYDDETVTDVRTLAAPGVGLLGSAWVDARGVMRAPRPALAPTPRHPVHGPVLELAVLRHPAEEGQRQAETRPVQRKGPPAANARHRWPAPPHLPRLVRQDPRRPEEPAERPVLTLGQVVTLADEMPDRYRALVLITTFACLRWGEVAALKRQDINTDVETVRIRQSSTEIRGEGMVLARRSREPAGGPSPSRPSFSRQSAAPRRPRWERPNRAGLSPRQLADRSGGAT